MSLTTPLVSFWRRWRSSLAAKFVLLVAALTALTLGMTAWVSYHSYREAYLNHLHQKAELLAEFVASISPDRIYSYDFSTLYKYVRELSKTRDIVYAVVIDSNGEPLTAHLDKDDPIIASAIRAVGSEEMLKVIGYINHLPDVISITAPIIFNNNKIGSVIVGATRKYADQELSQILLWNALGSTSIILLLSAGIYFVFRHHVLRPTQELMEGAQRVARGNLRQPIPLVSTDELGQLAGSFNDMMGNLEQSNLGRTQALEHLRDLNRTLEIRVEERTRAIETVNRELEHLALYDPLTGLANRSLLQDRLEQMLKVPERTRELFTVMLLDLDRFKEVNDTFGHHTGDVLLKKVGRRLVEALRETDTIGRLGGDEFAILLPKTDSKSVVLVANKLSKALEHPEDIEGLRFIVSASLGIAVYPEHGTDASTLLKHADIAMYEAKQSKTGYCIYHREIDIHSPRRLALMNDLRVAVEAGQMQLHYQPILDLGSGAVRGVEALARWVHPEKGSIPPDQFIPIIEQTGLIRPFSRWVIDTALCQWAAWHARGIETVVSVNLSMRNLQDKEFPNELAELLQKWSVVPHTLLLEVTESAVMSDPDHVLMTLGYFHDLGVDVAIDDFGTGYSSLSYLKRLPVNEIKIDRSFVRDMREDKDDAMIVRSTIDLAHNLGLKVVAEGVEDEVTLRLLTELNCDLAQGYHFSRPVPADQVRFVYPKLVRR